MPLRQTHFKKNKKYFHIVLAYTVTPLFKEADWLSCQKILSELQTKFSIEIQAYVLMDSHQHLLISTERLNENYFTAAAQMAFGSVNDDTTSCEPILTLSQYLNTYKYIYRNPVEAGLSTVAEAYPYSSLYGLLGRGKLALEVIDQLGLIQNPYHVLSWLNSENRYKHSKLSWLDLDL